MQCENNNTEGISEAEPHSESLVDGGILERMTEQVRATCGSLQKSVHTTECPSVSADMSLPDEDLGALQVFQADESYTAGDKAHSVHPDSDSQINDKVHPQLAVVNMFCSTDLLHGSSDPEQVHVYHGDNLETHTLESDGSTSDSYVSNMDGSESEASMDHAVSDTVSNHQSDVRPQQDTAHCDQSETDANNRNRSLYRACKNRISLAIYSSEDEDSNNGHDHQNCSSQSNSDIGASSNCDSDADSTYMCNPAQQNVKTQQKHRTNVKPTPVTTTKATVIKCALCNSVLESKELYDAHVFQMHRHLFGSSDGIKCVICNTAFIDQRDLDRHMCDVHIDIMCAKGGGPAKSVPIPSVQCSPRITYEARGPSPNKNNVEESCNSESRRIKRFACSVPGCVSAFLRYKTYEIHIRTVHGPLKDYACTSNACGEKFPTKHRLKHVKRHTIRNSSKKVAHGKLKCRSMQKDPLKLHVDKRDQNTQKCPPTCTISPDCYRASLSIEITGQSAITNQSVRVTIPDHADATLSLENSSAAVAGQQGSQSSTTSNTPPYLIAQSDTARSETHDVSCDSNSGPSGSGSVSIESCDAKHSDLDSQNAKDSRNTDLSGTEQIRQASGLGWSFFDYSKAMPQECDLDDIFSLSRSLAVDPHQSWQWSQTAPVTDVLNIDNSTRPSRSVPENHRRNLQDIHENKCAKSSNNTSSAIYSISDTDQSVCIVSQSDQEDHRMNDVGTSQTYSNNPCGSRQAEETDSNNKSQMNGKTKKSYAPPVVLVSGEHSSPYEPGSELCVQCGIVLKNKTVYERHMYNKHPETVDRSKIFSCTLCDSIFFCQTRLNVHVKAVHTERRPCVKCGKMLKPSTLAEHMMVVHQAPRFKCEQCDQVSATMSHLRRHIEDCHQRIKRYKCSKPGCNSTFTRLRSYEKHIEQIHDKVKGFPCTWSGCDRSFYGKFHLARHMLQHTGEKPIQCFYCTYRCRQRISLKLHIEKVHPDKPQGLPKKTRRHDVTATVDTEQPSTTVS